VSRLSKRIFLICEECGVRMVFAGTEEARRSEPNSFGCRCGEALPSRLVQDGPLLQRITGASDTT
jgi:hypothetical protein